MVIYNVTVKVDADAATDWVKWMQDEHISDVIATGLFYDARLCKLMEMEEDDGVTYVAQYYANDMDQYHTYIDTFAMAMREKGHKAFGGRFTAFRSVMEVVDRKKSIE